MGHWLMVEAQVEVIGGQVVDKGHDQDAHITPEKMGVADHEEIPEAAGLADAGALGQDADDKGQAQGQPDGGPHGAGASLGVGQKRGSQCQHDEERHLQDRDDGAFEGVELVGPTQGEASFQEEGADVDAQEEADKADPGVEVAGRHTQDHAQGAAQEDQGANHDHETQEETGQGG